jgi:DNA repair protein SbcD/Mre11
MRFIHTADWHLGRQFHNVSLIEDQRCALEQLVAYARDADIDAFVLAGDVFDRAVPGPDAVELLDQCLSELVLGLRIPVIMIAGNHDSGRRLDFASGMLAQAGLHVFGKFDGPPRSVTLADQFGPVHFVGMPYAEPALVREASGVPELLTHGQAMAWLTSAARDGIPAGERSVCVAHCFVAGGVESESERPLSVGGMAAVASACFTGFSYAALGHLHRPQALGRRIHYSGSLLKYSFSEIPHLKSANLVELDATGVPEVEYLPLKPRRDLRLLEGELAELLRGPAPGDYAEDFLLVRLADTRELLDPMGRLREIYPNVLHIERPALAPPATEGLQAHRHDGGDRELFAAFYEQVTGTPLAAPLERAFVDVYEALLRKDREAPE